MSLKGTFLKNQICATYSYDLFIYLFIVLRFQTSYNNCIKEAGTPQQLNTNYSGPRRMDMEGWIRRHGKWTMIAVE